MKKYYLRPGTEILEIVSAMVMSGASKDTGVGGDDKPMPKKRTPAF